MKLDELHNRLFDVLCIIDDICKKENVRYFLDSGTELGAIREGDFIPWDDDLDIKVLAEDYTAFKAAMEKHLPEHMHFAEPQDRAPAFYDFTVRIYDDRYPIGAAREEDAYYKDFSNHVGTDVFVMAKAPNSAFKRKMRILSVKILYGLGMSKRHNIDWNKYHGLEKIEVGILYFFGKMFSANFIYKQHNKLMFKDLDKPCEYRIKPNVPIQFLRPYPDHVFTSGTAPCYIRGREFPTVKEYEEEMRLYYGDTWRTPLQSSRYIRHLDEEDQYSV